jgi:hypothetical protein
MALPDASLRIASREGRHGSSVAPNGEWEAGVSYFLLYWLGMSCGNAAANLFFVGYLRKQWHKAVILSVIYVPVLGALLGLAFFFVIPFVEPKP